MLPVRPPAPVTRTVDGDMAAEITESFLPEALVEDEKEDGLEKGRRKAVEASGSRGGCNEGRLGPKYVLWRNWEGMPKGEEDATEMEEIIGTRGSVAMG